MHWRAERSHRSNRDIILHVHSQPFRQTTGPVASHPTQGNLGGVKGDIERNKEDNCWCLQNDFNIC